jgi:spore maturation protein CgeB
MKDKLRFRCFAHSWVSDWNHGNAHFLRGLMHELVALGHEVRCYEQLGSWSLNNLVQQEGTRAIESIDSFRQTYRELDIRFYNDDANLDPFLRKELNGADIVIVHEWNEPHIVNTVLALKDELKFRALFHDTHHRAYTRPGEILRVQLNRFDGVLAFGEAIRRIYADGFGVPHAWTFHEAADVDTFKPLRLPKTMDVIWIGNWGDGERTSELEEFLIGPAEEPPKRRIVVHGVRYPKEALVRLAMGGIDFRGYLPNLSTPQAYAQARVALHVPRRQYSNGLSGIPTIRVFEALACGIPLICSPWTDVEGLFRPGEDYLIVPDGSFMKAEIERLLRDSRARHQIADNGLETIRSRHTCHHRAEQLLEICREIDR